MRKWASRKSKPQSTPRKHPAFVVRQMKPLVIGISMAISLLSVSYAGATELPAGYSCMDLRSKASEYGSVVLISMAKSRGLSDHDILAVRKKCRV